MNDTLLPLNRVVDRLVLNDVLVSSFVKYYKNINCCKNVIQIKTRIKLDVSRLLLDLQPTGDNERARHV